MDPRKIVGLLADENRLRVVAAIVLGAKTSEEITTITGLDQSSVIKAIVRLEKDGLVERISQDSYRLRSEVLRETSRPVSNTTEVEPKSKSLDRFISAGHLTSWPKSQDDQLLVLGYLANLFEFDQRYHESEVNTILGNVHEDYALLRRYLVDKGFLDRVNETDPKGISRMLYWRIVHQ